MARPENWTRFDQNGLVTPYPMELRNGDVVHQPSWFDCTGYEVITLKEEREDFELVGDEQITAETRLLTDQFLAEAYAAEEAENIIIEDDEETDGDTTSWIHCHADYVTPVPSENVSVIGSQHGSTVNRPMPARVLALEDSADASEHGTFHDVSLEDLARIERSMHDTVPDESQEMHGGALPVDVKEEEEVTATPVSEVRCSDNALDLYSPELHTVQKISEFGAENCGLFLNEVAGISLLYYKIDVKHRHGISGQAETFDPSAMQAAYNEQLSLIHI